MCLRFGSDAQVHHAIEIEMYSERDTTVCLIQNQSLSAQAILIWTDRATKLKTRADLMFPQPNVLFRERISYDIRLSYSDVKTVKLTIDFFCTF
jgi:hypothetical protein